MKQRNKKIARAIYQTIIHLLAVLGIIFIGLIAYWWPVIDRLARPCAHYPQAFADCRSKGE